MSGDYCQRCHRRHPEGFVHNSHRRHRHTEVIEDYLFLMQVGETNTEAIAKRLGVTTAVLYRHLRREGIFYARPRKDQETVT